jgi:hypothetical protein
MMISDSVIPGFLVGYYQILPPIQGGLNVIQVGWRLLTTQFEGTTVVFTVANIRHCPG